MIQSRKQEFILSIFSVSVGLGINLLFILILKIIYLNKTNLSNTSGLFSLMQATSENIRFLDIFFIFVDCREELDKNEAYISAINIIFSVIAGFAIILTIFNSINGSIYEIMSQSVDFGVLMAIGINDKQLEEIISKKIEDRVAIPAILGVVLGSIFVFLMSKVLIEVSTIKLNISTPWILYLFIIITAILSVKIGTKYVCNKMKKLSPTDIINNV